MRKITELSKNAITVKVMFDREWEEYRCQLYVDGQHQGESADYHTGDKEDALSTAAAMLKDAEGKEHLHTLKKGDIIYNSWGYEQTNIDFYQVVKTTKCYVVVLPIEARKESDGPTSMTGQASAIKDSFTSEITSRHKATFWRGRNIVKFQHGGACQWDGTPKRYNTYA